MDTDWAIRTRSPALIDVVPLDGRVAPGRLARVACRFSAGAGAFQAILRLTARHLTSRVASLEVETPIPAEGGTVELSLHVPDEAPRGYHPEASWHALDGAMLSRAASALLVIDHWSDAPCMGFLADFRPDMAHPERFSELASRHLTVLLFYVWAFRHYAYLASTDTYEDGMGAVHSLCTVQRRIDLAHERGIAALAYGAVYGVEREYTDAHPEQLLRDADGVPHSHIDRFFITDPRPGPWRERLLHEYRTVVEQLGFDGVHMDQYGWPKHAFDGLGEPVDMAAALADLVDAAAARLGALPSPAHVTFNAVNGWPLETVAHTDQVITFVEAWPPHDCYRDLVALIRDTRGACPHTQLVVAAYLDPFREGGREALAAAVLLTAVIAVAGAHHLLIGEGNGVLRGPYYPDHASLDPEATTRLQRLYDHTAALHDRLFDLDAVPPVPSGAAAGAQVATILGAPCASSPVPEAIWVSISEHADRSLAIDLVNLLAVEHDAWNTPQSLPVSVLTGLRLVLNGDPNAGVTWISADDGDTPRRLRGDACADGVEYPLPPLGAWATVVVER